MKNIKQIETFATAFTTGYFSDLFLVYFYHNYGDKKSKRKIITRRD